MNKLNFIIVMAAITIAVVALAAAFASSYPDGLEFVADKLGFISSATDEPVVSSPLPDYTLPWVKSPFWSTAIAGLVGVAAVFLVVFVLVKLIRKR